MPKKPLNKKSKKDEDEITEIEPDEIDKIEEDTEYVEDDEVNEDEDYVDEEIPYDEEGKECTLEKLMEDDEYDETDEIEIQPDISIEYVSKEDRQSSAKLTKYEMVRILGERTKQLTMGAKALIKNHKNIPYEKIAEEELKLNMIPFKIRRPLPNGKFELWTLEELNKEHLLSLLD